MRATRYLGLNYCEQLSKHCASRSWLIAFPVIRLDLRLVPSSSSHLPVATADPAMSMNSHNCPLSQFTSFSDCRLDVAENISTLIRRKELGIPMPSGVESPDEIGLETIRVKLLSSFLTSSAQFTLQRRTLSIKVSSWYDSRRDDSSLSLQFARHPVMRCPRSVSFEGFHVALVMMRIPKTSTMIRTQSARQIISSLCSSNESRLLVIPSSVMPDNCHKGGLCFLRLDIATISR